MGASRAVALVFTLAFGVAALSFRGCAPVRSCKPEIEHIGKVKYRPGQKRMRAGHTDGLVVKCSVE